MESKKNFRNFIIICGILLFFILAKISFGQGQNSIENQFQQIINLFRGIFEVKNSSPTPTSLPTTSKVIVINDYEKAKIEAVKKVAPAVVSIVATKDVEIIKRGFYFPLELIPPEFQDILPPEFFTPQRPEKETQKMKISSGSGFIVSPDGLIVTNKHVVSDDKAEYTVFLNDGREFKAKVIAKHPIDDLAVLKINASNLPYAEFGSSDSLELGQTVIAIGNALGEFQNTVSVGVISGLRRNIVASDRVGNAEYLESLIQTDAAINYGNSGGPLIDLNGQVIGVNTAIVSGAQNIGFAIPASRVVSMLEKVKKTGRIQLPFLGIRYIIITEEIAKSRGLPVNYGALIEGSGSIPGVLPGTPAKEAGLREGDIILEVDGEKITKENSLAYIISKKEVGQKVKLKVLRGNNTFEVYVSLTERPENL